MEYKILKSMSIITAIISGIFTIMATTAHSVGMLPTLLAAFMGISFDVCKFLFAVVALTGIITTIKFNGIQRAVCGIFAIALFAYSIYASQTFLTDQSNKYKAVMIENSDNISTINQDKEILQKQYDVIQSELQTLQAQSEKNLSRDFITVNKNEILPKIESKTVELKEISNKLQELDVSKVSFDDVLKAKCMSNFTVNLTEWLNSFPDNKKKPLTPSGVDAMIQSYIAIIFELLAIILWWLQHHIKINGRFVAQTFKEACEAKHHKNESFEQKSNTYDDYDEWLKAKNRIGFDLSVSPLKDAAKGLGFDDDQLKSYLEYMYNNACGNVSPGYQKICKDTGLPEEACRKIKGHLERTKVIEVIGNKTLIIKPQNEVYA